MKLIYLAFLMCLTFVMPFNIYAAETTAKARTVIIEDKISSTNEASENLNASNDILDKSSEILSDAYTTYSEANINKYQSEIELSEAKLILEQTKKELKTAQETIDKVRLNEEYYKIIEERDALSLNMVNLQRKLDLLILFSICLILYMMRRYKETSSIIFFKYVIVIALLAAMFISLKLASYNSYRVEIELMNQLLETIIKK